MKTGYMEYDTTTYGSAEIVEIAAGDKGALKQKLLFAKIVFKE